MIETDAGEVHLRIKSFPKENGIPARWWPVSAWLFYVLLTNLSSVTSYLSWFIGSFKSIFLGVIFVYIINPLARFFYYRMFKRMKVGQ